MHTRVLLWYKFLFIWIQWRRAKKYERENKPKRWRDNYWSWWSWNNIIVKSDSGFIDEEIEKLEKYEKKIVTEKWYNNCIKKNEYKPIDEKEDLINLDNIKNNYEKIINEIESGKNKKYIDLFSGKKFSIEGFRNETKSKIIDIITFCSGLYIEIIVKSTNYIIVPLTFDNINLIQKKISFLGIRPNIFSKENLFVYAKLLIKKIK